MTRQRSPSLRRWRGEGGDVEVPLLTVEQQVTRVLNAGFHVYCMMPTGIVARVLAAHC